LGAQFHNRKGREEVGKPGWVLVARKCMIKTWRRAQQDLGTWRRVVAATQSSPRGEGEREREREREREHTGRRGREKERRGVKERRWQKVKCPTGN
jgi:hypothetical protein